MAPEGRPGTDRAIGGSCLCGAVAFRLDAGPRWLSWCHCTRCRKAGGLASLTIRARDFHWVRGEELVARYVPEPPYHLTRCFCRACGSYLGEPGARDDVFPVAASALDDDPGVRPILHEHTRDLPAWYGIHDGLPQYEGAPPLEAFLATKGR